MDGYFLKGFSDQLTQGGLMGNRRDKLARERFEYLKNRDKLADASNLKKLQEQQAFEDLRHKKGLLEIAALEEANADRQGVENFYRSVVRPENVDQWHNKALDSYGLKRLGLMANTAAANEQSRYLGGQGTFKMPVDSSVLTTKARIDESQAQRDYNRNKPGELTGSLKNAQVLQQLSKTNPALVKSILDYNEQLNTSEGVSNFAPHNLTKLIDIRDSLPADHPDRKLYEQMIKKTIAPSSVTADPGAVFNMAKMVYEGRLNPAMISKRGGLQSKVFGMIEEMYPETNLVELQANAIYKTAAGNLQSRALIGGVQPLLNELVKKGETLNNARIQVFNKLVNSVKLQTGDPDIVAFNNLRDGVIAETERILLGSGVLSDAKYLRALENVNSSQSLSQLKAAVTQMELEIRTRLHALDDAPFQKASKFTKNKKANTKTKDPLGIR